jgi:hypothetical protein
VGGAGTLSSRTEGSHRVGVPPRTPIKSRSVRCDLYRPLAVREGCVTRGRTTQCARSAPAKVQNSTVPQLHFVGKVHPEHSALTLQTPEPLVIEVPDSGIRCEVRVSIVAAQVSIIVESAEPI